MSEQAPKPAIQRQRPVIRQPQCPQPVRSQTLRERREDYNNRRFLENQPELHAPEIPNPTNPVPSPVRGIGKRGTDE